MKLLFGYTLDYLKRNRRSSFAIMVAILMTSTMMSALCGFLYNVYVDSVNRVMQQNGNWHGELFSDISGDRLATVKAFERVEAVLVKGQWKAAAIDDPRRDYLIWRDANAAYWDSMPEGDRSILEGRAPAQAGEIALSKQYFEHHPALKLGDTLTLTQGDRMAADGTKLDPRNVLQDGEQFVQTATVELTVVGKLDFTTSSTVPAYTALGFLDEAQILPEDALTVYLRFYDLHDTYEVLPEIARAVGYEPDEYGAYPLRYNTEYLARKNVFSQEQRDGMLLVLLTQGPLTYALIGLLVVALFVVIIHNAFALSSSARMSQLGIFASVGATPKQIKDSVILEGLLLTVVPLPIGLILGQLCVYCFITYANQFGPTNSMDWIRFVLGWQSVLPAILLTLLTVFWSALIPARKVARVSPIAAIRQGETETLKRQGRFSVLRFGKLFGLAGELAANALHARKKSYRTATISLTLSFLTLCCFFCNNSSAQAAEAVYRADEKKWAEQDVLVTLNNVTTMEDCAAVSQKIESLDTVAAAHWYTTLRTAVWLPEDGFSNAFAEKGGFAPLEEHLTAAQIPLLRDGKRRVKMTVLGLDDATFAQYCERLGLDAAAFYEGDEVQGILYHTVEDVATSTKRTPVPIPFFDVAAGDKMTLTEAATDSAEGDYTFSVRIAAVADEMPPVGSAVFGVRYSAVQVMPMSRVRALATHFVNDSTVRIEGVVQTKDPAQIAAARGEIERICSGYFGSGDYALFDESEYFRDVEAMHSTQTVLFGFIVGLLAVIGLSNAWCTVRGTLYARRREFAMLRAVGLPPRGVRRMLSVEAVMLGLTPVLLSLPVILVAQGFFLALNEITLLEWLPFCPWLPVLAYVLGVLSVTALAYWTGGQKLLEENIIDGIRLV